MFNKDKGKRQSSLHQLENISNVKPKDATPQMHNKMRFHPGLIMISQPSEFSWADAKRVFYYWDAGLRNACRESRAVMLKHSAATINRCDIVPARDHYGQRAYVEVRQQDIVHL